MERLAKPVIERILYNLRDISSKKTLQTAWTKGTYETSLLSYSEMFNVLYNDNQFDRFLSAEISRLNFGEELNKTLADFEKALNDYDKNLKEGMEWEHEKILQDPEFDKVIEKAGIAVKLWREDKEAKKFIVPNWEKPPKDYSTVNPLKPKKTFWGKLFYW